MFFCFLANYHALDEFRFSLKIKLKTSIKNRFEAKKTLESKLTFGQIYPLHCALIFVLKLLAIARKIIDCFQKPNHAI